MSATAPVVMDRFASANGDFYAESSGNNRHRRATVPELKEHFQSSGSGKDRPAHWYEAQLIHYGLPPSKTKSVAFKCLFDASNTGALSVPAHITKLESDLKKEWTKRDRDAKKEAKGQMVGVTKTTEKATAVKKTTAAGAGAKRKASESLDVTVSVGGIDFKMSASNSSATQSTPKKAKTTKTTTAKTTKTAAAAKPVKESPKSKPAPKTTKAAAEPKEKKTPAKAAPKEKKTPAKAAPKAAAASSQSSATKVPSTMARRGGLSQGSTRGAAASSPPQPRTKQTARRGGSFAARGGLSHSSARDVEIASPPRPRTKQTARRGGGFPAYGGHSFMASQHSEPYDNDEDDDDEPPPPYSEYGYDDASDSGSGDNDDDDEPLDKLGLLNGRYEIESADVSEQWPHLGSDFSLVLTLAGDQLWGTFDLGLYEGVLRFDVRPYESSREPLDFMWRGQESEGPIFYGNGNSGSITFLGGGRIKGKIDAMDIHFSGRREAGQGTKSEVNITTMRNEWNSYTEQEYERLNRARWGGSSW